MNRFERAALARIHALGGETCGERFQLRHHLEHADELRFIRLCDNSGAMRRRIHEPARRQQPDRLAHGRARNLEAARKRGLIKRSARRDRALHDLVGELQTQLFGSSPRRADARCNRVHAVSAPR